MKSELQQIPGVGPNMARHLERIGCPTLESLRDRDPEELYVKECLMKGRQEDRCALYVWRAAVYYAGHETRDPEKLKWWYWKDKPYPEKEDL